MWVVVVPTTKISVTQQTREIINEEQERAHYTEFIMRPWSTCCSSPPLFVIFIQGFMGMTLIPYGAGPDRGRDLNILLVPNRGPALKPHPTRCQSTSFLRSFIHPSM